MDRMDEQIASSTYEAGEGIYFGRGLEHTNINVEDELLDEIHASTSKNVEQDVRLDEHDTEINNLKTRVTAVENKNAEQDGRLTSLEGRMTNAEDDISGIKNGTVPLPYSAVNDGNGNLQRTVVAGNGIVIGSGSVALTPDVQDRILSLSYVSADERLDFDHYFN